MAQFCLPRNLVDTFKERIAQADIAEVASMSSEKRREFFTDIVGEANAKEVNTLFESKLILKNKKQGLKSWVKTLTNVSEETQRDMAARIEKLDEKGIFDAASEDAFLEDLAEKKLGFGISSQEAQQISDLSKKVQSLEEKGGREYGKAYLDLQDYIAKISPQDREGVLTTTGGLLKSLRATLDLSAPLRQGRLMFGEREWRGAVKRMFSYATSENALRNRNADIVGHQNYKLAKRAKLALTSFGDDVSKREEQFSSKFVSKIPLINNSDRAYSGFLTDLRFEKFNTLLERAKNEGIDIESDKFLKGLGTFINSATGRGDLGAIEPAAKVLADAFFSPRFIKSRLDYINPIYYAKLPPFVRKQALKTSFNLAATTGTLMAIADASGLNVEWDPRSADFGKVKFGDTRVDLTGGYSAPIRLTAQILSKSTKSSTTGEITKLNTDKFGARTTGDVLIDFFGGKEAPLVGIINDLYGGKDFDGNEIKTAEQRSAYLLSQMIPLIAKDVIELYEDGGLDKALAGGVAAFFGANVQTYGSKTEKILSDEPSFIERVIGVTPRASKEFAPLLDKMTKNQVTFSLPTSATTIKPPGQRDSREMTDKELTEYKKIYKENLRGNLKQREGYLLQVGDEQFTKVIDNIKRETTEESKLELIRKMLR